MGIYQKKKKKVKVSVLLPFNPLNQDTNNDEFWGDSFGALKIDKH